MGLRYEPWEGIPMASCRIRVLLYASAVVLDSWREILEQLGVHLVCYHVSHAASEQNAYAFWLVSRPPICCHAETHPRCGCVDSAAVTFWLAGTSSPHKASFSQVSDIDSSKGTLDRGWHTARDHLSHKSRTQDTWCSYCICCRWSLGSMHHGFGGSLPSCLLAFKNSSGHGRQLEHTLHMVKHAIRHANCAATVTMYHGCMQHRLDRLCRWQ